MPLAGSPSKTVTCSRAGSSFQTSVSSSHAQAIASFLKNVWWYVSLPTSSRSLCLPPARMHFCVLAARGYGGFSVPRKYGLNWFIPALAKSSVGSLSGTTGEEGTKWWPCFLQKKSMNCWRISVEEGMGLLRDHPVKVAGTLRVPSLLATAHGVCLLLCK